MAYPFFSIMLALLAATGLLSWWMPGFLWVFGALVLLFALGSYDMLQRRHSVLRNFPLVGRFRYLLEMIRPEINQYFIESNTDGTQFNREIRSLAYQRAKLETETLPFGTQRDVYEPGYEWINHSINARNHHGPPPRIRIGGDNCTRPYEASLLNISAMSFGSLSSAAIEALNAGARKGNFYHNTGEGSISPYHTRHGGDLVWQIGTGYFGCRNHDGSFNEDKFAERANQDVVRMIELKLSQGAKPGHGGILPAGKITEEIATIRDVPRDRDVVSPPAHTAFERPRGLLHFLRKLQSLADGQPVGFKLCVGMPTEFLALCQAMVESDVLPDFITVDGGEGETGAAPLEFSNSIGAPLTEGLVFVHNALTGFNLRDRIRVIASA